MGLKHEFMVERQGKAFCLYAGLLDAAHEAGLVGIDTQLIQVPSADNGNVAICTARVTLSQDGVVKTFTGIGDASPENVSRMMAPHILRMAETRAKARALRDAVNVGAAALEELSDGSEDSQVVRDEAPRVARPEPPQHANGQQASAPHANGPSYTASPNTMASNMGGNATPNQVRAIYAIGWDQQQKSSEQMDEMAQSMYGSTVPELTKKQASDMIASLQPKRGQ